jgi:hypothetical protein
MLFQDGNGVMPFSALDRTESFPTSQLPSSQSHAMAGIGQFDSPTMTDLIALVQQQTAQITALEDERDQRESRERAMSSEAAFFPEHAIQGMPLMNFQESEFNPNVMMSNVNTIPHDKLLVFAGKGFGTFLFGASNPLSIVSTAPRTLQAVSFVHSLFLEMGTYVCHILQLLT